MTWSLFSTCFVCVGLGLFAAVGVATVTTTGDVGFGFSLSLDYATSAVSFANGTSVALAKIEGSPQYKQFMRIARSEGELPRELPLRPLLDPSPPNGWYRSAARLWQVLLAPSPSPSADLSSIHAMFRALKVSTESYMGDSVRVADVAIPVPLAEDQCAIIQAALRAAGLRSAIGSLVLAAQEASRANGIGEYDEDGDPPEDPPIPPELVFAVDYTRAALTIVLYVEEYGVFERIRMRHRVDLGADAMPHPADAGERYWDRVRSLVREIVQAPIEGLAPGVPHTIGQLVLLGERATKARFLQTLHDVLGEHVRFSTHARLDNDNDNDTSEWVDPVFAAAVGMAIESRKSVNELVNAGGNS